MGTFRAALGIATLRSLRIPAIPDEHSVEPLSGLVLRVLYRLRSLCERQAFDGATLGLAMIMMGAVVQEGGIGYGEGQGEEREEEREREEKLEQVALVVEVISFHTPNCAYIILRRLFLPPNPDASAIISRRSGLPSSARSSVPRPHYSKASPTRQERSVYATCLGRRYSSQCGCCFA